MDRVISSILSGQENLAKRWVDRTEFEGVRREKLFSRGEPRAHAANESDAESGPLPEALQIAPMSSQVFTAAAIICWSLALGLIYLAYEPSAAEVSILIVSLVAFWRYSWWINHVRRAWRYDRTLFPSLRARAERFSKQCPSHVCVLVTSYKIDAAISRTVYRSLISELVAYGAPATVLASVTGPEDEALVRRCANDTDPEGRVEIIVQHQDGSGKRVAMANGLRALSHLRATDDALVVLMDGDTCVPADTIRRTAPFLLAEAELGALTVDNRAYSNGGVWTREWYELRLAQRHLLMKSMALSRRLLVLTGRFSIFRATLALHSDFINRIEHDCLENWRLGRITFLTGDDKSTWFWVLKNNWKMLYVPDVSVDNIEMSPADGFLRSSVQLMHRWFGNMLRANGRAVALGPRRLGFFTWWCLIDQRLSMWTTLVGPASVVWAAVGGWGHVVFAYLGWITLTRTVAALFIGRQRRRFSPFHIPLLYFQQLVGAAIKIHVTFRLNQQRWTRQNVVQRHGAFRSSRTWDAGAAAIQTVSMIAFFYVVGLSLNVVDLPTAGPLRVAAAPQVTADQIARQPTVFSPEHIARHAEATVLLSEVTR